MAKLKDLDLPIGMDIVAESKLRKYFGENQVKAIVLYEVAEMEDDGVTPRIKKGKPVTEVHFDTFTDDLVQINKDMYRDLTEANKIIINQNARIAQMQKSINYSAPLAEKYLKGLKNRK